MDPGCLFMTADCIVGQCDMPHPGANIIAYQKEFTLASKDLLDLVSQKGQVVIFMTPDQLEN